MIFERPHFKEYIMARTVTLALVIFVLFSITLALFIENSEVLTFTIFLMALSFSMFIYMIYRGAAAMQEELKTINRYLRYIEDIDSIDDEAKFFTKEFEEINYNLVKVLKKSRKREDLKQKYNTKLKLKNRQRADMISAIAHEFRNPIASIIGYSQTLQEDKEIPESLREKFLAKIVNNGDKIEALLARLVLWNKFESGEAKLHRSSFGLKSLSLDIQTSLEEKYKSRFVIVEGEEREVAADRTLMEVVLKNLIENALKYSRNDVYVRIDPYYISIQDSGVGISEKDIEKVTKKFYRSDKHNWDNSMGLGLSIVKKILLMHDTELKIESVVDKGSIFSFKI